jgi:ribonuclease D
MSESFRFDHITNDRELEGFVKRIRGSQVIAFDTEFVSEDRYLPELCLLQVRADEHLGIVDTLSCRDLSPFWELVVDEVAGHTTVVHAAREEFRFCLSATGRRPARMIDTQIASGLIGLEFPAAYSTLVSRLAGKHVSKHETRTNWRHRPLSKHQLQYAIQDVAFLPGIYAAIRSELERLGREDWLAEEMHQQQSDFEADAGAERWDRLPGISSLQPEQLAVARELWRWRQAKARELDQPVRRVLRDDLLVELARQGTSDRTKVRSIRGMDYGRVQKLLPEIGEAIDRGLQTLPTELPRRPRRARVPNMGLLGQFLATALGVICRDASVSPNLVASTEELRAVAAWRLGLLNLDQPPRLFSGWRKTLAGDRFDEFLAGTCSLRVVNPQSDQPLAIVR